eukprot:9402943-Ditylum_brightwellii.AAC.1
MSLVKFPGGKTPVEPPWETQAMESLEIQATRLGSSSAKVLNYFKKSIDVVLTLQLTNLSEDDPKMAHLSAAEKIKLIGAAVIDNKIKIMTLVLIEFIIPKTTKVFSL